MTTLKEALEKGGMGFTKMTGNELIFNLTEDLSSEEDYKIWDVQANKFFNSDDDIVATTGETIKVHQTKFLPMGTFNQFFPNKRKTTQIIRTIEVNGQVCRFGFKKTADEQLVNLINSLTGIGNKLNTISFKMTKTGTGMDTAYKIEAVPRVQNVVKPQEMPQKPLVFSGVSNTTPSQGLSLKGIPESSEPSNDLESQYVNSFKTQVPKNLWSLDTFIKVALDNKVAIPEYRLEALYKGL